MSDLRKQLQSAKTEYASAKYPGDLAYELLAPKRSIFKIVSWSAAAAAVAAIVAIAVWHGTVVVQPGPGKPTVIVENVKPVAPVNPTAPTPISPSIAVVPTPTVIPTTQPSEDEEVVPSNAIASVPEMPSDVSFIPSDGEIVPTSASLDLGSMPSMPSMPSLDFSEESSTSTNSKESV